MNAMRLFTGLIVLCGILAMPLAGHAQYRPGKPKEKKEETEKKPEPKPKEGKEAGEKSIEPVVPPSPREKLSAEEIEVLDSLKPYTGEQQDKALQYLNTVTKKDLTEVKGVGFKTADRITYSRPYKTLSDVAKVKGVGVKTLLAIVHFVVGDEKTTSE